MMPSPVFGGYDADAVAHFARMTSTDSALRNVINDIIVGLKEDGIWNKLDAICCVHDGANELDSLLNLKGAFFDATNVGCTFTANRGFTTAAATLDYLRSGFTEDATTKLSESDATIFTYNRNTPAKGGAQMGAYNSNGYPEWIYDSSSSVSAYMQTFSGAQTPLVAGFQAASRIAGDTHICVKRTTVTFASSAAAKTLPYYEYYIGTYNQSGSLPGGDWSDGQYAAWGCGSGMTPAEFLLLEARLQTYMTARGAAV